MFTIQTFNNISQKGLMQFPADRYSVGDQQQDPDGILLRSYDLHDYSMPVNLKAVVRAGTGVNNIPVEAMTACGIPVFNTPGANANAVKELVISALLLASRHICQGWNYVCNLQASDEELSAKIEKNKKQFRGFELAGKKLGVIGLGAIGVKVANAAVSLGMDVLGYDPRLTVQHAWELSSAVVKANSVVELLKSVDFVTFHIPFSAETKHLLNAEYIQLLKPHAAILNFSRGGVVDEEAILTALKQNKQLTYVSDFPSCNLLNHPQVIFLPHLGGSTVEAEENCAVMAVKQMREFLEKGNINNSVNFPEAIMSRTSGFRLSIVNANIPNMVGQVSAALVSENLNILNLLNQSRNEIAYTLLDLNQRPSEVVLSAIREIEGVLNIREII